MKNINSRFYILILVLFCSLTVHANVEPNGIFTDHMVLQQGVTVPVWGRAEDGEKISVTFNGQDLSTTAKKGIWMVKLKKLTAGGPFSMTIKGKNTVVINDILVGEVWLCGGQSNMDRKLGPHSYQKPILNWERERDEAIQYPQVRQYEVPKNFSMKPLETTNGKWEVCSPQTVINFSAVGYFFAKNLYKNLKVPVGIIYSSVGGTNADRWTSRAVLENNPELVSIVKAYDDALKAYPEKLNEYKKMEPKPAAPPTDYTKFSLGDLYNTMILPLQPYAMKGVCWYQGEANSGNPRQYPALLTALIDSWRSEWKLGSFPFLIVQIAPFTEMRPGIREAQLFVTKSVANTALIVTTDCGDATDIHPANKEPVGERLALAARALGYGQKDLVYAGPTYESIRIEKDQAIISFTHIGEGLMAKGGELTGFMIAGDNKDFVPATAKIIGDKVVVSSTAVKMPAYVRFGWKNVPDGNLYNTSGLPASPFRTDGY